MNGERRNASLQQPLFATFQIKCPPFRRHVFRLSFSWYSFVRVPTISGVSSRIRGERLLCSEVESYTMTPCLHTHVPQASPDALPHRQKIHGAALFTIRKPGVAVGWLMKALGTHARVLMVSAYTKRRNMKRSAIKIPAHTPRPAVNQG